MRHLLVWTTIVLGVLLFANVGTSATYYVATTGSDSNPGTDSAPWRTVSRAAQRLQPGDAVFIRGGTYHEQVILANSGSDENSRITYAAYPGETPILDGTGVTPYTNEWGGLIDIGGKSHIVIRGLTVRNTAGMGGVTGVAGIHTDGGHDITVTRCTIYNTRSSGVGLWNSTNTGSVKSYVTSNDIYQAVNGGTQECISVSNSSYVDVSYNAVHGGVNLPNGGEGIDVKEASRYVEVHHNTVYDLPGDVAIYIDAYASVLSNVAVYGNMIYEAGYGIGVACEQGGTANNVEIYNNVVRNTGTQGIEITSYGGGQRNAIKIYDNTVYANATGGINIASTAISGVEVYNNISASNGNYQLQVASEANIATFYNLLYGTQGSYKGTHYLTANPLFVSATDMHLQPSSPAIDTGTGTGAPLSDYDGVGRPQGSGYDMGAYEYVSADKVPPTPPTGLKIIN